MGTLTKHWFLLGFLVVVAAAVVVYKYFLVRTYCLSLTAAVVEAFHCP